MPKLIAPLHSVTSEDRGAVVVVVAYSLLGISLCFSAARFIIAYRQRQEFRGDDVSHLTALVFSIGQSITADRASNAGLGRHITQLSQEGITSYFKAVYALSLIAIVAMYFAKLSVVLLFERLWVPSLHSKSIKNLAFGTTIWFLFSFLAHSFQCGLPHPWMFDPKTCSVGGGINYPIIITNALTDAVLALWIIQPIRKSNIHPRNRTIVILLFATRLLVTASAVAQLAFVTSAIHSSDQTWSNTIHSILLTVTTHLSVVTSTIPRIHSFLADIQAGHVISHITDQELAYTGPDNQTNKINKSAPKRRKGPWSWFSKESSTQEHSNFMPKYVQRRVIIARPERVGAKDSFMGNASRD
ncbi:hypothetical protein K469DRAFT_626338 [Zopfia rhizophila CBS 207.26]|uniref:Rhodopsin domain-containing protein n=1 Tax=Zopfia rhizophila CBS 207.26 TaxID=1314779 RepID=A0A6A6EC93_9PEZI|nr:hypothetical protein K469DRAFT_626338 [Zopfia rhizophila CBS 207.26]